VSDSEWPNERQSVPIIMTNQASKVEAFSGPSKRFSGF
jgi:hypothetical protein